MTGHTKVEYVRQRPTEGEYIHGLFLDGCAWSKDDGHLVESEPKQLFSMVPVIKISGKLKGDEIKVRKAMFGAVGPYECPVYKYPSRTDRFFVVFCNLMADEVKTPMHWGLRGVALLC